MIKITYPPLLIPYKSMHTWSASTLESKRCMDLPEATNGPLDRDSTDGTDGSGLLLSDGGGGELPDGGAGCVGETEHGEDGDGMECNVWK